MLFMMLNILTTYLIKLLNLKPNYFIRLDDACPTQNLKKWNAIEKILERLDIKPIVAVIPNNCDHTLHYSRKNKNFWKTVKRWQNKGWLIGMHGYKHNFHYIERSKLLLPFYDRSEFAGLDFKLQCTLIKKAYDKFARRSITPILWIAPAHSFDEITLDALREVTNIRIVSDGIFLSTIKYQNFTFIPQQLWDVKKKFFGVWTICLHPNTMSYKDIKIFERKISDSHFIKNMAVFENVLARTRKYSFIDSVYANVFWLKRSFIDQMRG
jgi:predicted deacetylase